MDNSNNSPINPATDAQQPPQIQPAQAQAVPPKKSNKKIWIVLLSIAAVIVTLVVVALVLIDKGPVDSSGIRPVVTNGYLDNNYAKGVQKFTLDYNKANLATGAVTGEFVRVFIGASVDRSKLLTHSPLVHSLDIYNTADGTSQNVPGMIGCTLVSKSDSVYCIEDSENLDDGAIVEVSASSGLITKRGATMKSMTGTDSSSDVSEDIGNIRYLGKVGGDKHALVVEQLDEWVPSAAYLVLLNNDLSFSWSTKISDDKPDTTPFCIIASSLDRIACSVQYIEQGSVVVVDVNDLEVKGYDIGEDYLTLASDGWVLRSEGGESVTAFDLKGNIMGGGSSNRDLFPKSLPFYGSDVVFESAKSLLTNSLMQPSSLVVNSDGDIVAKLQGTIFGDNFKSELTGKSYDGRLKYVSLDGRVVLAGMGDEGQVNAAGEIVGDESEYVFIDMVSDRKIFGLSKEESAAPMSIVNGVISTRSSTDDGDRQIIVYLPKQ